MSTYSQADLLAIAKALKSLPLEEELNKATGVESQNPEGKPEPSGTTLPPTQTSQSGTAPTPAPPEAKSSDLDKFKGTPRPTKDLPSFAILQIASRVAFVKEIEHETSTFLPSSLRMYHILHELDEILVQNFYFRRAIPSFLPTQSRIYLGILFIMQVFRCMNHVNKIDNAIDQHSFNEFFRSHPLETLPVPGPLIPLLSAICVSKPQDATLPRVSPAFPANLGPNRADALYDSAANFVIPNIPMLFGLHEAITAYVTNNPNNTSEQLVSAFGIDGTSTVAVAINGFNYPAGFVGITADQAWMSTSAGIGQPFELNEDLLSNFKANRRVVKFPTLPGNAPIRKLDSFTRVASGAWFATLKRNMKIYCSFVRGSGTMQDVSIEGPASGQILSHPTAPVNNDAPTGFFVKDNNLPGDASYTTTMPANDELAQLTSVYSQINIRGSNHHSALFQHIGETDTSNGIQGNFWEVRPIRPPTSVDHVKDSLSAELALYVKERATAD